jgi:hypothetical protein
MRQIAMTENTQSKNRIIQFILTEKELEDIYRSANFAIGEHTVRTQLKLSKPEREKIDAKDVSSDHYLLSLKMGDLEIYISGISSNHARPGYTASYITRALQQGLMQREIK